MRGPPPRRDLHEPQAEEITAHPLDKHLHPGIGLYPEATESPTEGTMTILTPNPVSTAQLHWDGSRRQYTGEISATNGLGRVYDDACDLGLTLVGKTGRQEVFVVDREVRDAEGDITHWVLRPARPLGGVSVVTLILFNT